MAPSAADLAAHASPAAPRWMRTRVARPAADLARSTVFYRDLLGFAVRGGFRNHSGYDGVFLTLPGGGELELTAGPTAPTGGTEEDLLVLYLGSAVEMRGVADRLVAANVPSQRAANPYWNRVGQTFLDPDGYRVVLAATDLPAEAAVVIDWHRGSRAELRALFGLAEDSVAQLDSYLDLGRVLVARRANTALGHLQLVPTRDDRVIELKNMAVLPDVQRSSVGRALVEQALTRCRAEGWARIVVSTAAADTGNLRFYQRVGFRLQRVEPDAFTTANGYPAPIEIDGITLRDRVWLTQGLH